MQIRGHLTITDSDTGNKIADQQNKVVQSGRTAFLDLIGKITGADLTGMTHIAIGSAQSVTVSDTDITLADEFHRMPVTNIAAASPNSINVVSLFHKDDCRTVITEAGIFGGSSATDTADTGTLFTHVAFDPPIDNSQADNRNLTASWEISLLND